MSTTMTTIRPAVAPVSAMSATPRTVPSVSGGGHETVGASMTVQLSGTPGAAWLPGSSVGHGTASGIAPAFGAVDHRDRAYRSFRSTCGNPITTPTITSVSEPSSRSRAPSIE